MGAMASAVNGRVAVPPIDSKAMIAAYNDTSAPAGQMAAAQALAYYLQQTHDEDLIYQMCCKHVPGWEAGKTEKTSFNLLSGSLNTSSIHEVEVNPVSTLLPDAPECVVFSILIVQGSPNLGMNWWSKAGVQQRYSAVSSLRPPVQAHTDDVSILGTTEELHPRTARAAKVWV
jgi:hypothetical protein